MFFLQWQAGIRHQPQLQQQQKEEEPTSGVGFHTVKSEWGWNWLERWMAVRPWETHFIEEAKEGTKSPVDEPRSPLTERKPLSSIGTVKTSPRLSKTVEKRATDGCSPSPRKTSSNQETPTTPVSSRSPRTLASRPNFGSRSFSTPRERSTLSDAPEKKRLSLPGKLLSHSFTRTHRQHKCSAAVKLNYSEIQAIAQSNEHLHHLHFLLLYTSSVCQSVVRFKPLHNQMSIYLSWNS